MGDVHATQFTYAYGLDFGIQICGKIMITFIISRSTTIPASV